MAREKSKAGRKAPGPAPAGNAALPPLTLELLETFRRLGTIREPLSLPHPPGTLSVVMIVRNEARNIVQAVESFRPVADEIIVNDTGSADGTQEILDGLGVAWFQSRWENDFSLARNQAMEKASCSWILWMDADDRIPPDQVMNFLKLKTAPLDRAFGFQVINTQAGRPVGSRFLQIRMFPNHGELRFRYRIHEQIIHGIGRLGLHCFYTDTAIHHTGYEDVSVKKAKARRNLEMLAKERERIQAEPAMAMSVGDSFYILEEWRKGIEAYKAALAVPRCREINADVYNELPSCIGRGYQKLGRPEEAIAWFDRSHDLQPRKPEPLYYKAECLLALDRPDEARGLLARVADMPAPLSVTGSQIDAVRVYSFYHLARLDYQGGRYREAVATLRRLLDAYPHIVEARQLLGRCLRQLGEPDEAEGAPKKAPAHNGGTVPKAPAFNPGTVPGAPSLHEVAGAGDDPESLPREKAGMTSPDGDLNRLFGTIREPLSLPHPPGTLSVVMIVRNEARNIVQAVESFRPVADEIIVNDTGSADGTQEILDGLGVAWFQSRWENDFSLARNQAMEKAACSWILWMDADDRIPPDQVMNFLKLKTAPLDRAFGFQVINTQAGRPVGPRFLQVRLFPNHPALRFQGRVHEQILPAAASLGLHCIHTETVILHTGYEDRDVNRSKARRNLELLGLDRDRLEKEPALALSLGDAYFTLDRLEEALDSYRRAMEIPEARTINEDAWKEAHYCMAKTLHRLGRLEEAWDWYARALAERPEKLEALYGQAEILEGGGRHDEAVRVLEHLLSLPAPRSGLCQQEAVARMNAWHRLTRLDLGAGRADGAAARAEAMRAEFPYLVEPWHLLGQALRAQGRITEAIGAWMRGLQLNPAALPGLYEDLLAALEISGKEGLRQQALELARHHFPGRGFSPAPSGAGGANSGEGGPKAAPGGGQPAPADRRMAAGPGEMPRLSLCMIVKNEAERLGQCLDSVRSLADEIVVVDTGSTDGTQELARSFGARIIQSRWEGDFSQARNLSLSHARGRWVLWLDADDILLPRDAEAIAQILRRHEDRPAAFGFLVKNSQDRGRSGTIFNQIRLFPNRADLRFTSPVHEQILPAIERAGLPVEYTDIQVIHTGYASEEIMRQKQRRNREILERQLREGRDVTAVTLFSLGNACLDLGEYEAAIGHFAAAREAALAKGNNPHIAKSAPAKRAACLCYLGRFREAAVLLDRHLEEFARGPQPPPPEAMLVKAQAEEALGRDEQARPWYERLLACREGPTFVPLDFRLLKTKALRFLGRYWNARSRQALAVELLKAGLGLQQGGDFGAPDLAACYRRHGIAEAEIPEPAPSSSPARPASAA